MQPATQSPGRIPAALNAFAANAVSRLVAHERRFACALGEVLSEPKVGVWFNAGTPLAGGRGVLLDRRTRMMYDTWHVFVNGESYRASGRDAALMRGLADRRALAARAVDSLSAEARGLLDDWALAGWLHAEPLV